MREILVKLYRFLFHNILFSCLKLFRTDDKKIIYISHYGSRFNCNPRCMFEYIQKHYPDYSNVIVMNGETENMGENVKIVKYHSVSFLYHLATAKYWVANTNLHADLKPKKGTVYFQTWHAAGAFKKFGLDLPDNRQNEKMSWKKDTSNWTKMISSSKNIIDIYSNACGIDQSIIHPIGLPRNDIFFDDNNLEKMKREFYLSYNIEESKKIILYAPTFRDSDIDDPLKLDFKYLEKELKDEYVFILKLHPKLSGYQFNLPSGSERFLINLTSNDDIQELLLIADVLITDYSSVIFDYAISGKPIVFYSYDLQDYERGFYFEYKDFVPGPIVFNQESLVKQLSDYNRLYEENYGNTIAFAKEFNACFDGKSTERAVKLMLQS